VSDDPTGGSAPGDTGAGAGTTTRPLIELLGLGAIAVVIAGLFGTVAYVTLTNGEIFLGVMALTGALMTVWAAGSTLRRG
jgi:hypothetical protein